MQKTENCFFAKTHSHSEAVNGTIDGWKEPATLKRKFTGFEETVERFLPLTRSVETALTFQVPLAMPFAVPAHPIPFLAILGAVITERARYCYILGDCFSMSHTDTHRLSRKKH